MKTAKLFYPAVFHKEDTGYSVWLYDIDGCVSQGETLSEACENIKDALGLYFEEFKANEKELPEATEPTEITNLEHGEFVSLIEFNYADYLRKHDNRSVKKTLSIPSWLNYAAEANHINFSGVLQEALRSRLDL